MGFIAFLLIPESLKFLIERRPANALQSVNRILGKLKKPLIDALPEISEQQGNARTGLVATMLKLLAPEHRKLTLTLWITFFLCFATLYFLMSWIPKLVVDAGYSSEVGRDAFFLFNFGGVLGVYVMGICSTRWKLTNLVGGLMFVSALFMLVFAYAPREQTTMLVLIFVIGVLLQGGFTGLYSVTAKAYPTAIRSTGVGWSIGLGRFGAVVGPAVAGYTILFGLDMSANFVLFAIPMAIGGIIAYSLNIR